MKRKLKPIPRSKAKNAYDLLTDVRTAIVEEPKRLDMSWWVFRGRRLAKLLSSRRRATEAPACGTIACAAGWTVLLAGKRTRGSNTDDVAFNLLGGRPWRKDGSYDPDGSALRTNLHVLFLRTQPRYTPGTDRYARYVANRIRDVQAQFKDRLLATPITRPKPKPKTAAVGRR